MEVNASFAQFMNEKIANQHVRVSHLAAMCPFNHTAFYALKKGRRHKPYPLYYYVDILNALLSFADNEKERSDIFKDWAEALRRNVIYVEKEI